jgi:hypothetical protein
MNPIVLLVPCTGGHKNKLFHIKGKPNWLPPEVWIKKKRRKLYTDVVTLGWYGSKKNQRNRVLMQGHLVIYYDGFDHPWEFVPLKGQYTIREQNTSRYWYKGGSKREAIHPPRREE